jgi:hypothetical protein
VHFVIAGSMGSIEGNPAHNHRYAKVHEQYTAAISSSSSLLLPRLFGRDGDGFIGLAAAVAGH